MLVEGIEVAEESVAETGIAAGELYMAQRNSGWKLLTCREYHRYDPETCSDHYEKFRKGGGIEVGCGLVWPQENAYPFYDYECYRVKQ